MNVKHLSLPVLALAFASHMLIEPERAQADSNEPKSAAPAAASTNPDIQDITKFSQDGNDAIREINSARLAIFNGDPKLASDMITKAQSSVAKAEKEAPTFTVKITTSVAGKKLGAESQTDKAEMVPVDGELVFADDFVPTPEKQEHVRKANEHLKNGKTKDALEELRLGEIELSYNRVWMPLASASRRIAKAEKFMEEQKYYEASLALKAIVDSLSRDSVSVIDVPKSKS
jgi:hypothetical protein